MLAYNWSVSVGDAHLPAHEQTVWTGGGRCAPIGQLLPLQAVWQVSRTSHTSCSQHKFPCVLAPGQTDASSFQVTFFSPECSIKSNPVTLT